VVGSFGLVSGFHSSDWFFSVIGCCDYVGPTDADAQYQTFTAGATEDNYQTMETHDEDGSYQTRDELASDYNTLPEASGEVIYNTLPVDETT
jgi:hypothetical protein